MRTLVACASRHGATSEIATRVAAALQELGHEADVRDFSQVGALEAYDAFVLGSAIYYGHWTPEATKFIEEHAEQLRSKPVWLFASGPLGDPLLPANDRAAFQPLIEKANARDLKIFAGKLERSRLSFIERFVTRVVKAPEGDFRDWDAVQAWAGEIAAVLARGAPAAGE